MKRNAAAVDAGKASDATETFHRLGKYLLDTLGYATLSGEPGVLVLGPNAPDGFCPGPGTRSRIMGLVCIPAKASGDARERFSCAATEWIARRVERVLPPGEYLFCEPEGVQAVWVTTSVAAARVGLVKVSPAPEVTPVVQVEAIELADLAGKLGDGVNFKLISPTFVLVSATVPASDLAVKDGQVSISVGYSRYAHGKRTPDRDTLGGAALESLLQRVEQLLPPRDFLILRHKDAEVLAILEAETLRAYRDDEADDSGAVEVTP